MKRLTIYFFWDKDGVVDDYVLFYLKNIKKFSSELCVVVNEPLTKEGRDKLSIYADCLLVRENVGFDSWAYKYALEFYGYDRLYTYDSILLNNFTTFGPIFSFDEMFQKMDSIPCDFWGINRHPALPYFLTSESNSKIVEHIQSYFIDIKSTIIKDPSFKQYWDTLKPVNNYYEAIAHHENRFTKYFESRGFVSATYMPFDKYERIINDNASILCADRQLIEDKNPLIKRKAFCFDEKQVLNNGNGLFAKNAFDYIKNNTEYDHNLIIKNLLRTNKMSSLRHSLHLNYYFDKDTFCNLSTANIALVDFVYYEDMVNDYLKYIKNLPRETSIYLISPKKDLLHEYEKKLRGIGFFKITCRHCPSKGRDVAAYLIEAKDVFENHDYICCMHDKKTSQLNNNLVSSDFNYHCWENNLASLSYIAKIIETFEKEKALGMLVPPELFFSNFYWLLSNEISSNEEMYKYLYKKLDVHVPFDEVPVAPFGTMFWIRGKAFKTILKYQWSYDDFPNEPIKNDGTILHAIERFYPIAVQNEGYYVGWLATTDYISAYNDNLFYHLRLLNKKIFFNLGSSNYSQMLQKLDLFFGSENKPCNNQRSSINKLFTWINLQRSRVMFCLSHGEKKQHYYRKKQQFKTLLRNKDI